MVGDIAMGCIVITLARIVGWKLFWLMEKILRTGMGALPKAKTFAENKYGYGPYVDGLFHNLISVSLQKWAFG